MRMKCVISVLTMPGKMWKRKSFLELSLKLREKTKGRVRMPSEVLIREDRDSGYRNI